MNLCATNVKTLQGTPYNVIPFVSKEYLQGNPEKARKELGWKPKFTFNVSLVPSATCIHTDWFKLFFIIILALNPIRKIIIDGIRQSSDV